MKYISDVLAKTADMANHSIEDVVAATTEGGDMFKKVNQSIENFNASLVALAKNNMLLAKYESLSLNTLEESEVERDSIFSSKYSLMLCPSSTTSFNEMLSFLIDEENASIYSFISSLTSLYDFGKSFSIYSLFTA